jgi:hypothetical protein
VKERLLRGKIGLQAFFAEVNKVIIATGGEFDIVAALIVVASPQALEEPNAELGLSSRRLMKPGATLRALTFPNLGQLFHGVSERFDEVTTSAYDGDPEPAPILPGGVPDAEVWRARPRTRGHFPTPRSPCCVGGCQAPRGRSRRGRRRARKRNARAPEGQSAADLATQKSLVPAWPELSRADKIVRGKIRAVARCLGGQAEPDASGFAGRGGRARGCDGSAVEWRTRRAVDPALAGGFAPAVPLLGRGSV